MNQTVCLAAYSLRYIEGGAYMWVFLNWALGLLSVGCRVVWLESVLPGTPQQRIEREVMELRRRLAPYGLAEGLVVIYPDGRRPSGSVECLDLDSAADADLLLNLGYDLSSAVVDRFRRAVFVDIDPGLTQTWMSLGQLAIARHGQYFTYGETVGRKGSRIPDCGLRWQYTPPPVSLPAWPVVRSDRGTPYTTVSNWWGDGDWITVEGELVDNSKRTAFLNYLSLPRHSPAQIELALPLAESDDVTMDRRMLEEHGWRIRHVVEVSSTPERHRKYVQESRGEFSCMKHGYVRLNTAWTSERTLNYLASGKPAIVEYTGPSRLPEGEGLLRFRSMEEAVRCLHAAERNYEVHCNSARALAEEYFNGERVTRELLERALD